MLGPSQPKNFRYEREKQIIFPKTCLVLLAGKCEVALSCDKYILSRTVYINSAQVGLGGTKSTSDFQVVYVLSDTVLEILITPRAIMCLNLCDVKQFQL